MLVIAHRGARETHPENTLLAFEQALAGGATAIELDIHQHHGELWVIHDSWVNRTTNGSGPLNWFSLEKLKKLDAGQGEHIPTLKETFQSLSGRCALNIELKGMDDMALLLEHLDYAITHCQFSNEQLLVSSFNHHWLAELNRLRPATKIAALTANKPIGLCQFAEQLNAYSINVDIDVVDSEMVQDAKMRGLKVFVYTVNRPQDWQRLHNMGVDGVFCDAPSNAVDYFSPNTVQRPFWP
ncbi:MULTISPECIES: glycerophosphodiester phosphodiesterase family protein [Vibrio]|uniref:Putative glycerophosphoryl diester phosphodiesterase n=1 Tax=Vibrio halioticoli NBRC 102217 TaxID=1219072 RepID=V5FMT0_9VIBR|nr:MULTISPECIES: glycerophosphodiester phosphodiesterase family protein [Vibrio]MPW37696.1 glycerophosphodiester phosphodiesterase [Vibrio sp. B1Z05]GAD90147.1 putative glycerophosphoryl diester phosphodiesterase [Vibrio halioticoli NBRC 102217]